MDECSRVTIEGWPLESGAFAHTTCILPRLYFRLAPHDRVASSRVVYVCHTKVLFGARI